MNCPRCQSLLVQEVFVDYEAGSGSMSFLGYRCLNCGEIIDATILRHRAGHRSPLLGVRKKARIPISIRSVRAVEREDGTEGVMT
ncbi:MAG: hypothetical protein U0236_03860 [Nitrospira sp.]